MWWYAGSSSCGYWIVDTDRLNTIDVMEWRWRYLHICESVQCASHRMSRAQQLLSHDGSLHFCSSAPTTAHFDLEKYLVLGSHTYITMTAQTWQQPVGSSAVSIARSRICTIMQLHRSCYGILSKLRRPTKIMAAHRGWAYGSCHVKGNIRQNSGKKCQNSATMYVWTSYYSRTLTVQS